MIRQYKVSVIINFYNKKEPLLNEVTALTEVPTRFELVIKVLQTFALPLGYGTL